MITSILTYLIVGSIIFFLEVVFPYGILGLLALLIYGFSIYTAATTYGVMGGIETLVLALLLAGIAAYWELRILTNRVLQKKFFRKEAVAAKK